MFYTGHRKRPINAEGRPARVGLKSSPPGLATAGGDVTSISSRWATLPKSASRTQGYARESLIHQRLARSGLVRFGGLRKGGCVKRYQGCSCRLSAKETTCETHPPPTCKRSSLLI